MMIPRKALILSLSLCLSVLDHGYAFQLPSFTRPIQIRQCSHLLPATPALSSPISLSKSPSLTTTRLESVPTEIWTCVLPPLLLGLYKSEYGVSYAYGTATALSTYLLAKTLAPTTLPYWHAAALIFYGVRLNVFLAVRTAMSKRMQEMVQTIEDRAIARGSRLSRLPFILSCGLLYYGLVAPVVATSQLAIDSTSTVAKVFAGLVGMQWFGFATAALGDFTKTHVKSSQKEENFLVTSGIYSIVRHPNYTGEIIGWTANAALGLMGAFLLRGKWSSTQLVANVASNLVGWMGILFVLLRATSGLETRQGETYGEATKYKEWVQSTWSGWTMASKKGTDAPAQEETPHLEVTDVDEDMGSGI
jgi:steroid 5-alpha reductase family enzyme